MTQVSEPITLEKLSEAEREELRKSLEPDATTGWKEWEQVASPFWQAFADTPEDEVIKDFEEALAEVRREQKQI